MLRSLLVFDQAPCHQKYFLVLQWRQLRGFGAFGGLRVFSGMEELVLVLFLYRVATFCWRSWINFMIWEFTSVIAFIVAVSSWNNLSVGDSAWNYTRARTPMITSSLILSKFVLSSASIWFSWRYAVLRSVGPQICFKELSAAVNWDLKIFHVCSTSRRSNH